RSRTAIDASVVAQAGPGHRGDGAGPGPGAELESAEQTPMKINVASRIERLPPYVLGRLKQLIYDRRKAGADVIDLNMGNPSDAPPDAVIEKIRQAVTDPRNSRYSVSA